MKYLKLTILLLFIPASELAFAECQIDADKAIKIAAKKGYLFKVNPIENGNAFCKVDMSGEIFVISARSDIEGKCLASVFVPPKGRNSVISRIALKYKLDGSEVFVQKPNKNEDGFSFNLIAPKGVTTQYKLMYIELESTNENSCKDSELEKLL